ncbi:Tetrathionate reductase subunit B [archaeon HR03]|uniref:Phenylacetyl-CoA:acceptor oxidoreductase subunit n=2 Tax=Thermoproteati TaxID=1783275 RepID=E6NAN3_CALS0|nr:phenylacetyl-CoA:acceptor oxidoreductase subunit [Candidatus Caldarchaeum subterraneum]BAL57046.1 phenylacetyl-CoA:acceptor oxidoreductase [uncultured crenarchaeote]GBC72186.1 Tetrathionate reductase subunit B [archaeon HR03]
MVRYGMVIDLTKCVGCETCTASCKNDNSTPKNTFWRAVRDLEVGEYPMVKRVFVPLSCMHCAKPPCLEVCPTTATRQRSDGIVVIDINLCMGCGYCIVACPYDQRWLVKEEKKYFDGHQTPPEQVNPFLYYGMASKCDFCVDRVDEGVRRGLKPGVDPEATPACVNSCISKALYFGDLDDPESEVARLARSRRAFRLLPEFGTEPSVYYLR